MTQLMLAWNTHVKEELARLGADLIRISELEDSLQAAIEIVGWGGRLDRLTRYMRAKREANEFEEGAKE